jgi:hypothetical protein
MTTITLVRMQRRRREIIRALSDLSRDGWSAAKHFDYAPLEAELREINRALFTKWRRS